MVEWYERNILYDRVSRIYMLDILSIQVIYQLYGMVCRLLTNVIADSSMLMKILKCL